MTRPVASALVLSALVLVGCSAARPPAPPPPGVVVLKGGRVWVGDPPAPRAQAVLAVDGRVAAVGTDDEVAQALEKLGRRADRTVELAGRDVVPGLVDAHVHLLGGGLSLDRLDLNGVKTREAIKKAIGDWARAHPDRPWIQGRGWSYEAFKPGLPSRADLDEVVPDRPVWLRSYDGHTGWANSKALAMSGVDERTADPADGRIEREPGGRRPSGALLEGAMALVGEKIPPPTRGEKKAAIRRALKAAAGFGLTTVCEMGGPLEDLAVYEELDREGDLAVRVVFGPSVDDGVEKVAEARRAFEARRPPGSLLWFGPLKGFVDGVVESNTAALIDPYADGSGAGAAPQLTPEQLRDQIGRADALGLDVAYHAVGDRSVRAVLDAVEAVAKVRPPRDRRPRIEHIETVAQADEPRFASLGVVASMMPPHAAPGDEPNGGVWSTKLGADRLKRAFAFNDLARAKASLAFGSDWPVATLNPLYGMAIAETRQEPDGSPAGGWIPEQRISPEVALKGYTAGAAWALRLEKETGALKPGLSADLAVLADGVRADKPATLYEGKVDLTLVAGRVVHEQDARR